jgi:poly(ADP-ribose) glycohydrolase
LKCILAYFKHIAKNDVYLKGKIRLQRTKNTNTDFMDFMKMDREVPLRAVEILSLKDKTIEDYYAKGIMIDFANKKLGGGVLKNGCVQEEVLFSIFPEAIVSKIIC